MARNIINISLPAKMAQRVRKVAKDKEYASVSEFFRDLLRDFDERERLVDLKRAQEEIRLGKGNVLRSLQDLR